MAMVEEGMAEEANDTLLPSTEEDTDRFSMTCSFHYYINRQNIRQRFFHLVCVIVDFILNFQNMKEIREYNDQFHEKKTCLPIYRLQERFCFRFTLVKVWVMHSYWKIIQEFDFLKDYSYWVLSFLNKITVLVFLVMK